MPSLWLILIVVAQPGSPPRSLALGQLSGEGALSEALLLTSPALQGLAADVAQARAELGRARLFPNPGLDLSVNTLPIGPTNPKDLEAPFLNVPNVQLGVSWLVELGKRGPRQASAQHGLTAAQAQALAKVQAYTLDVAQTVGDVAFAEVRIAALTSLAEDGARLVAAQLGRAKTGDTPELDAERAELEHQSVLAELGQAKDLLADGLTACLALAGVPCEPFGDPQRASAWLRRQIALPAGALEQRADLRALDEERQRALAAASLARARAAPDLTLRLGYVHDRFVVSGNQQNSLFVGVGLPLPFVDTGRVDAAAAEAQALAAERTRARAIDAAGLQLPAVQRRLEELAQRRDRLEKQSLPLAHTVVGQLESALNRGGAGLQELLHARGTLQDLVLNLNELDRTAYRLQLERARLSGALTLPQERFDGP